MIDRLAEDHANARCLAEAIAECRASSRPATSRSRTAPGSIPGASDELRRVQGRARPEAFIEASAPRRADALVCPPRPDPGRHPLRRRAADIEATIRAFREALDERPPTRVGASSSASALCRRGRLASHQVTRSQLRRRRADARAGVAGARALDDGLYDLVETRFGASSRRSPPGRRTSGSTPGTTACRPVAGADARGHRADSAHMAALEAMDPAGLSAEARFERELELHHVRLRIFRAETLRIWERRSTGASALGDALFHLFTRDFAPLPERLDVDRRAPRGRAAVPPEHRVAGGRPQVRPWLEIELRASANVPNFLDEIVARRGSRGSPPGRRAPAPRPAIDGRRSRSRTRPSGSRDPARRDARVAVRREQYGPCCAPGVRGPRRRAILEIGWEQLERNHADRRRRRARSTQGDRGGGRRARQGRPPATFDEALEGYRRDMARARRTSSSGTS